MHDSQRALVSASRALTQYLARVGRRVLWFKLVRGIAFTLGATSALLLICAMLAGPSLSPIGAALTWATVALGAVLSAMVGIGSMDDMAGARRAKLLRGYEPRLSARARAAAELTLRPNGSPELIASLARSVTDELTQLPLATVVPAPKHFRAAAALAATLAAASAFVLVSREDAGAGLYAMLHPGARDEQGALSGLWVSRLHAKLSFPGTSERDPLELGDLTAASVPEGTTVELTLTPRFQIERSVLRLGERTLPWTRQEDGRFTLAFTAEQSGRLELRARVGASWVTDAKARTITVENDATPAVELTEPAADLAVKPDQRVPFVYKARDDHGLEGIDLVVQLGPNRERRQRLKTFAAGTEATTFDGAADVLPATYSVRPGQTIAVWIEARDRDAFGGANVGRSPVRTLRVGERDEVKGPEVELLIRARDAALDALGERLELELSAPARVRKLARTMRPLIVALSAVGDDYDDDDDPNHQLVNDMVRRLSRLLREEGNASEGGALARLDRTVTTELEDDVLWLTDLIGRGKLEAAQESLRRLAATRARMRKLLAQLKETDDPAQRAELMAEIARARAELREIGERLSEASSDVPSDFVNYDALRRDVSQDPLEQLEKALAQGDMEAAERALAQLDERMASLENGLEGGSEAFRSERFGARHAALERARSELSELQHSQEQLAKETDRVAEKARERGPEERAREASRARLAADSEALEKRTRELEAGKVQPAVGDAQRSAQQRLRDARDALKQGETREARNMAERAAADLERLAMEMRLDARMYPGRDGSRMQTAREAEDLARDVSRFADQVGPDTPQGAGQLSHEERESLKQQAPGQGKLGERTDKLAEATEKNGPASAPDGLERASRSMRAAENALQKGDLPRARSAQREALEQLRETAEELEQQARASQGGRGGKRGDGSDRPGSDTENVKIPEGSEDSRRSELRRRVLDARRAPTPDAYGRSIERYYQEILR